MPLPRILITLLVCLLLIHCKKDEPTNNSRNEINKEDIIVYDGYTGEILVYDFNTLDSRNIGQIIAPDDFWINATIFTHSNMFIDIDNNQIITKAVDLTNDKNFVMTFDYTSGKLVDSLSIEYPFTQSFFYSRKSKKIISISNNTIFVQNLEDGEINSFELESNSCGIAHAGFDSENNLYYTFGCNITTFFDLETNEFVEFDNSDSLDDWRLIFSPGVHQEESYIIGFALYQRHFPEDPDFIGTFDSIRNELYLVKKNLNDSEFNTIRVDSTYGYNNGFFDKATERYFLHREHNNSIMVYDSDLNMIKKLSVDFQYMIKK